VFCEKPEQRVEAIGAIRLAEVIVERHQALANFVGRRIHAGTSGNRLHPHKREESTACAAIKNPRAPHAQV
jgi:hypothetical protein